MVIGIRHYPTLNCQIPTLIYSIPMKRLLRKRKRYLLKEEIWKPVPAFESYYSISNHGNIISHHKRNQDQIIHPRLDRGGYLSVRLNKEGKTYTRYVHRLLAESFIPNDQGLPHVHHRSGNKLQNDLKNLQWVTHRTNVIEAYKQGLNTTAKQIVDTSTGKQYISITEAAQAAGLNYNTCCKKLKRNDPDFNLKYLWQHRGQPS
jgi:hypothetical protein